MLLFLTSRDHQVVADWMAAECDLRGVPHSRLYTEEFPQKVTVTVEPGLEGTIRLAERQVTLADVEGVWHYLPGACQPLPDLDPIPAKLVWQESETTLGGVYRSLADRRWVNWPYNAQVAWYKAYQLRLAAQVGFKTPRTIITNHPDEALAFLHACGGQMVYKPMRPIQLTDPSGLPSHQVFVTLITQADIEAHLDSIRVGPCMFQEFFLKTNDLTIYVIGERVWAAIIHSQDETVEHKVDYRQNWLRGCAYSPVLIPPQIEEMCLQMTRQMGLAMCNFDLILTPGGDYVFVDANPTDQWILIEDLVGFPLCAAIVDELLGVDTLGDHPYIRDRSLDFRPNTAIKELAAEGSRL
jgi:hypothetical protein